MDSGYERLVRNDASRESWSGFVLGLALVAAVVLACLLAPNLPGETSKPQYEQVEYIEGATKHQDVSAPARD